MKKYTVRTLRAAWVVFDVPDRQVNYAVRTIHATCVVIDVLDAQGKSCDR